MKKSRLVIEIEKNGDNATYNLKVSDMSLVEYCAAVGIGINDLLCELTDDDTELFLMRVQAVRDISCSIGLENLSNSFNRALEEAKELIANEKEK
jgi:hypothetical protein